MTFEEDFPSLKELKMEGFVEEDGDLGYSLDKDGDYVQIFDVQKFCLDRERVKELVIRLWCAAGCECCRKQEEWDKVEDELGELLGIPKYEEDNEYGYEGRDFFGEQKRLGL